MEGRCDLCPPPPPGGCDGLGGMHDSHGWGAGGLWDLVDVRGPGQGLLRPGTSSHPAPACGPLGRAVGGQRGQTWEGPAQPCWGDHVYEVPPPCPLPAACPGPSAASLAQAAARRASDTRGQVRREAQPRAGARQSLGGQGRCVSTPRGRVRGDLALFFYIFLVLS